MSGQQTIDGREVAREEETQGQEGRWPGDVTKSFIAYSGGVESTTMLLLFGNQAEALFADTGWEHDVMYAWLDKVERLTGHKITRVRREGDTLPEYIRDSKYYPSPMSRFCTRMFKIEPINKFLADHLPCELMIGLNYDERDRTGNHGTLAGCQISYPLIDLKISRETCAAALKARDLYPSFPGYMRRGGCVGCFFKSKTEYYRMAREVPGEAYSIADLEEAIQDARGGHYGVRDGIPRMRRFLDNARAQTEFDLRDAQSAESSPCGVFCHR